MLSKKKDFLDLSKTSFIVISQIVVDPANGKLKLVYSEELVRVEKASAKLITLDGSKNSLKRSRLTEKDFNIISYGNTWVEHREPFRSYVLFSLDHPNKEAIKQMKEVAEDYYRSLAESCSEIVKSIKW